MSQAQVKDKMFLNKLENIKARLKKNEKKLNLSSFMSLTNKLISYKDFN